MAFLDNAGDIILDAVLTDAGRQRLARGNFKIVKFALGDEEINYQLFNSSHPSGSAFYDLEIMQTPILEAFTNNTSLMKSKLVSINRNNILYMPILKVNNLYKHVMPSNGFEGYYLTADETTSRAGQTGENIPGFGEIKNGFMHGPAHVENKVNTKYVCVDQGIVSDGNTDGLSILDKMPADMMETAYLVKVDHRLLRLYNHLGQGADRHAANEMINQFVDDDAVATYFFAMNDGTSTVFPDRYQGGDRDRDIYDSPAEGTPWESQRNEREMFKGPIGTFLRIVPKAADSIQYSTTLFDKLGQAATSLAIYDNHTLANYKYIDTSINVTGVTTGYSVDIPIRIIKKT